MTRSSFKHLSVEETKSFPVCSFPVKLWERQQIFFKNISTFSRLKCEVFAHFKLQFINTTIYVLTRFDKKLCYDVENYTVNTSVYSFLSQNGFWCENYTLDT